MHNTRKILSLLFMCVLVTSALFVSGCTENADDLEDVNGEETEAENISINDMADIEWQWSEHIETEPASQSVVPDPENYTLIFDMDETYSIKADCNVGSGAYMLEGNDLTLAPGPITLAYCGNDSLDTLYLSLLSNVTTVSMDNDKLVLGVGVNGDKMLFVKGEVSTENNEGSEPLNVLNGTISSFEDGDSYPMFLLESEEVNSSGYTNGIKFVISDETEIVDSSGGLFDAGNLKEGMEVRVSFGPALTKSIPPIGQAELIQLI